MLEPLLAPLRGSLALLLLMINTLVCALPLLSLAAIKARIPRLEAGCNRWLDRLVSCWISINSCLLRWLSPLQVIHEGFDLQETDGSFVVICNHQSPADIVLLQMLLNRRIPQLKFFLKQELRRIPVLGLCWWALGYLFMQRHSRSFLAKNPDKRHEDQEATRQGCRQFLGRPVTLCNFVEGTRFTPAKHQRQQSPFVHLLRPRAGGLGFVLEEMGDRLRGLLDITLCYTGPAPSFWGFLCGRCPSVQVRLRYCTLPLHLTGGDYATDSRLRARTQAFLNQLWQEKDRLLEQMKGHADDQKNNGALCAADPGQEAAQGGKTAQPQNP